MTDTPRARIVVGVDGSPDSVRALRWAARFGELLDARVQAVSVWHRPVEPGWSYLVAVDDYDWRGATRLALEAAVIEAFGTHRPAGLTLEVIEGRPAAVLGGASTGAVMLVVGSRGRGAFASRMLGSVGVACVEHAQCPVFVARGEAVGPVQEEEPAASEALVRAAAG